ncbi:MAG: ATP-binding protein [Syntrophomonadaceae bacterium]
MKQLLILSGKGGTGKTTVAGAFIRLSQARAYADCDVDAPNLHLVMEQDSLPRRTDYYGLPEAQIDEQLCIECDLCRQYCRFDAIQAEPVYKVDHYACEGCGVCEYVCPVEAVSLQPAVAGELCLYHNDTVFSAAQLKMGSGTSGKLVTEVKKQMVAAATGADLAIIDGSPGIGCPVIASLSGVDMVLIVAEPSISGISDMERVIRTARQFRTRVAVCVNKYDTSPANSGKIAVFCELNDLPLLGFIPYDPEAVRAVNAARSIADIDCPSGRAVREVFDQTMTMLFDDSGRDIRIPGF